MTVIDRKLTRLPGLRFTAYLIQKQQKTANGTR